MLRSALAIAAAVSLVTLAIPSELRAVPLTCTSDPVGAPALIIDITSTTESGNQSACVAEVRGHIDTSALGGWDVYIIVDSSGSTAGASGIDLDGDGIVGQGDWRAPTDPGDSTLRAELEAVRRALTSWAGRDVRVALIEYSAIIPIPPGEPNEQGRIRTVQGLTADFNAVRAGLDTIAAAGSVGATDYGGALTELSAEYDRSNDPARYPVAFFLSDGKPTFSRFPFDTTEAPDVEEAMAGAQLLANRGLPVHALEIGIFDDIGVLQDIATLTGARLLSGLTGAGILDAIAGIGLDPLSRLEILNITASTGEQAIRATDGSFAGTIPLQAGTNQIVITAIIETSRGTWTITCPTTIEAVCPRAGESTPGSGRDGSGRPGRGDGTGGASGDRGDGGRTDQGTRTTPTRGGRGGGGVGGGGAQDGGRGGVHGGRGGGRRWQGWPNDTAQYVFERWGIPECVGLEGNAPLNPGCDEALRQLIALKRSVEVGELMPGCALDQALVPGYPTVQSIIDELRRAIDRNGTNRCTTAAALAAQVTSGAALVQPTVGPAPTGSTSFTCTTLVADDRFDVQVTLDSPAPGSLQGSGDPCPAQVHIQGHGTARGNATHDVYFVVDTSGSTAGTSGRDVNGDTLPDSTLEAELEALRAAVTQLDPAITRVALIEFSAVIPIPPGEPSEQGRIRTVQPLTSDFSLFFAGLGTIRSAGSVGATDYGGALRELAAEFDRNGDPTRGHVAFFLSDGKPTFPRFPYDSTEPSDLDWALTGAQECATRGIVVNTFEVGVFDDVSALLQVATITGGTNTAALAGAAIVDALPGSTLVGMSSVIVRNELTGEEVTATLNPDGSFDAWISLAQGGNRIVIRASSDGAAEIVECAMELASDCVNVTQCVARIPEQWRQTDCP